MKFPPESPASYVLPHDLHVAVDRLEEELPPLPPQTDIPIAITIIIKTIAMTIPFAKPGFPLFINTSYKVTYDNKQYT